MTLDSIVASMPIWGFFVAALGLCLLGLEAGFRVGRRGARRADPRSEQGSMASLVAPTLGLLAFLLAFTFGLAASRFERRKELVIEEANAVGTAYLRTEFLPAPEAAEIRGLLREYADARLLAVAHPERLEEAIARSTAIHASLWSLAARLGAGQAGSETFALFVESLNDLIDLHATRLAIAVRARIPGSVWVLLYLVAALSFTAMGYERGLAGSRGLFAVLLLAISFSSVLVLIADLDRIGQGLLRVSQQAMVDVRKGMTEPNR